MHITLERRAAKSSSSNVVDRARCHDCLDLAVTNAFVGLAESFARSSKNCCDRKGVGAEDTDCRIIVVLAQLDEKLNRVRQ